MEQASWTARLRSDRRQSTQDRRTGGTETEAVALFVCLSLVGSVGPEPGGELES